MEFRVLGNVDVLDGASSVPFGGPRQRLLLATLLAARRRVVSLDTLTEALWGVAPPTTARSTLQTSVSKLRRLLAADGAVTLEHRPPGYLLDVPPEAVDADRFEADLVAARRVAPDRPAQAIGLFDRALGCWVGSAFAGFEDQVWAQPEAARLEELRLQAVEDRNAARLVIGENGAVVSELEGLAPTQPLRERLWCLLMTALHHSGRQAEALRVAAEFRRHLRDELGLDPSATLGDLERQIVNGDQGTGSDPSVRVAPTARPSPELAASLVGRDDALAEIAHSVGRARLVTLTGPGGVGKSTMAIEVARRLSGSYADGVRLAELASVTDRPAVVTAIAQSVQVERRSDRSLADALVEVLAPQELLLVLDNCEHVIDLVGDLVGHVLRWCPSVTVLATSREPIGLPGEVVRSVTPLEVPADPSDPLAEIAGAAAVAVFVARAADASPGFELTEANVSAVAELCIQLDGLPLALELAAARMASMTPRQLADRLSERFALLGSGNGRTQRHRTLLDLVQWSYGLLDESERALLAQLSVFAGGFDLEAVELTCAGDGLAAGSVAAVLSGLVDKSLVVGSRVEDHFRYTQLETLRQFGADRLAEQPDGPLVHRAHLATFVERAVLAGAGLDGPDEGACATRFERDHENLRAALTTAIAVNDADAALQIVVAASEAGFRSIRYEVVDWAETVVRMGSAADHPLLPTAMAVVGYGAFVRGELELAVEVADRAVELRRRLRVAPCGLPERVLGNARFYQGHRAAAMEWISRMVDVARAEGSSRLAHGLYMLSVARTSVGDADGGALLASEAEQVATLTGGATALAQAAYAAGLAVAHTHPERSLDLLEQSADLADSVGNQWMRSFARTEAMWVRAKRGELDVALVGYRDIVETWFRGGDWANQWLSIRHLAGILSTAGRDDEAALLWGAVRAAGAEAALPFDPVDAAELDELHRALTRRLGDDVVERAARRGASMREDAAVGLALAAIDSFLAGGDV